MSFIKKYSLVVGISILIAVVVLLLSSSDLFFSSGVSFIDTDLYKSSGDEVYVKTKMDFGNSEHMENFPLQIEDWIGVKYDAGDWKELLNADTGISLAYTRPGLFPPVYLVIVQSESDTSFHPPDVCYQAQGYEIEGSGKESVVVDDPDWMEDSSRITVPLAKLVVYREAENVDTGKTVIDDRWLVMYCYVKENQYTSDMVTMIRVSTRIPVEGSYGDHLGLEKQFFSDALPLMFQPEEEEDWNPVVMELADWGVGGYFLIVLLVSVPFGIMVFPKTRWGKGGA